MSERIHEGIQKVLKHRPRARHHATTGANFTSGSSSSSALGGHLIGATIEEQTVRVKE